MKRLKRVKKYEPIARLVIGVTHDENVLCDEIEAWPNYMILPTIIRTTQEALRTVPQACREGALGLGAPKWYMIRTVVLPSCRAGILTGCILSVGRIVGESAALLFTAGVGTVIADNILEAFSKSGGTLSVALYMYVNERGEFEVGFAIAAVLMILVLLINGLAKLTANLGKKK